MTQSSVPPDIQQHAKDKNGVWWMPAYDGTPAGAACITTLPPMQWGPKPGQGAPAGLPGLNPQEVAAVAYKYLQLPRMNLQLVPHQRTYVNFPTWAYTARYPHPVSDTATATVNVAGLGVYSLSETVTATEQGGLTLSTIPTGVASITDSSCGPYGSANQNAGLTCGVIFDWPSPSENSPYTVQATTTWAIIRTAGIAPPPRQDTGTARIPVYEIQSISR